MRITTWPSCVALNGQDLYKKIMDEMIATGDELLNQSFEGDAAFIWSVLWSGRMSRNHGVWKEFRSKNKPVIVAEVGGLVRDKTWRLTANGINRSAIFPKIDVLDPNRPAKLGLELKPWHGGDYVLICGQHEKSQQWEKMPPMDTYYKNIVLEVRKHTDRPIVIRSHPRYREKIFFKIDEAFYKAYNVEWNIPKKIHQTYDSFDLENLLAHCHCVISHSSNSGVAAVLAGTPVIVSEDSLAYEMGTSKISDINHLSKPDRSQWLIDLAHKEWFTNELGQAWRGLRSKLLP